MITLFYTYIYYDPSRNNEPFYVGKGKENRAYDDLTRKDHHPMTYRLQKMAKNNITPYIRVINATNEQDALNTEQSLILQFGRKDLDKGPLLNLTDGGEGASGAIRSTETLKKMSSWQKGKRKMTEEQKLHLSNLNMGKEGTWCGRTHTEETKK